jgi:MFS family permease
MLKNIFLLAGMWGMGLGAAFVQLPATQNLLVDAGYSSISTVPLGIIMLGSSPCAVIIPKIISNYGEKKTFIAGSFFGIVGALMQMIGPLTATIDTSATEANNITTQVVLVVVGALPQAFMYASTNNLRFSVSQFSTQEFLPKATALVLLGGVLSALLGPLLSAVTRFMIPGALYAGNYLQIALMYVVFAMLAFFADFKQPIKDDHVRMDGDDLSLVERQEGTAAGEGIRIDSNTTERTLWEIIKETDLPLLTIFQCLSYNIMAMYMGQFKLPMTTLGYSVDSYTYAITAHMLGMFLPGLFSGQVVSLFGTWVTTTVGFLLFPVGGSMFLINDSIAMFVVGITIVGIGWNFSFVGPSAEVSKIYSPAEQAKVVGFNDGIMLLTVGIFFLTASKIYIAVGSWNVFNYILIGFSVFSALLALLRGLWKLNASDGHDNSFTADSLAQSLLTAGSLCTL